MSIYLSLSLSLSIYPCFYNYLSIYVSICLSMYEYIYNYKCVCLFMYIYMCVRVSAYVWVFLPRGGDLWRIDLRAGLWLPCYRYKSQVPPKCSVSDKDPCERYHHHHHVVPLTRISLTLSRHFSLSFIDSGRSSGLHPVSSHSFSSRFVSVYP